MGARLISCEGRGDIVVEGDLVVVGRHHDCDVRLHSSRVSRRHCCLAPGGEGLTVRDLGSTNGTFVNGRRICSAALHPGDELRIGHLRYRLEALPGGPPAGDARPHEPPRWPGPGDTEIDWPASETPRGGG
jgi:predicted component of type VI protein secretion system